MPKAFDIALKDINSGVVETIEQHARNNIELTLDGVIDFINHRHKDLTSNYKVFKEQFVVCWAGKEKKVKDTIYYSRVDIELINEQVKLFYSALDEISISYDEDVFSTLEYVQLGLGENQKYYPLEKVNITFLDNGTYGIKTDLVFEPPQYDKKLLHHIFNANAKLIEKLTKGIPLNKTEKQDMGYLPDAYLICYVNGFDEALDHMKKARSVLKKYDRQVYLSLKEALRVIRKVRYS
ncbi:MAG: DUF5929 domain-containing protein, partial [Flavobacteriaceae bacterium]